MAKKNPRKANPPRPNNPPAKSSGQTTPPRQPQKSIRSEVDKATQDALQQSTEVDLLKIGDVTLPTNLTPVEMAELYKKMDEAWQLFGILNEKFSLRQAELDDRQQKLDQRSQDLSELSTRLDKRDDDINIKKRNLERDQAELQVQTKELAQKTADLSIREENAKAGFQSQFHEVYNQIERLNAEVSERQVAELKSHEENLARLRKAQEDSINALYQQHQEQMRVELDRIEALRNECNEERRRLDVDLASTRAERKILERDIRMFEAECDNFDETVAKQVAKDTTRIQDELNYFKDRFNQADKERKHSQSLLISWNVIARKVGKDADAIPNYIEELEKRVNDLNLELQDRPSVQAIERIARLEEEKGDLDQRCSQLERELEEKRHLLSGIRIGAIEKEDLYKLNMTLEASRKDLQRELENLKNDIESRLEKEDSNNSPFPQCYAFDHDPELTELVVTTNVTNLEQFAEEVQLRIANRSGDRPGLFYRDRDIRSFIGGLAMSRMMILQGISGTGKTSLAVAFAEVVGGGREVIEVQAGWRDRDDLIGHYNSFEKKFYEKKFLQALYKAQCPAYVDRFFIILLDELNLSYPEQYFADLLSALQMNEPEDRKIDLIPQAPANRPYPSTFINDNRSIQIPENVWFIGTANRDETTKDIADKTYDRSHILELPNQHPAMKPREITISAPCVSVASLQATFANAQKDKNFVEDVDKAWQFLERLRPTFTELGVGWGNRMKGHLDAYLPVVRACGGSWYEATDDLFAMKILRKIRDRYEILPRDLESLLNAIDKAWKKSGTNIPVDNAFERSIKIIEDEDMKIRSRMREEQA